MYGLTPPLPAPSLPQGEAIDRIEDNVNAAANHVQRGTHALIPAVPIARRNRKVCQLYLPCAFVIERSPYMDITVTHRVICVHTVYKQLHSFTV